MIFHTPTKPGANLEQDLYVFSYTNQARRLLGAGFVWFFVQHSSKTPAWSRICMIFHTPIKPGAYLKQDLYGFSYIIQARRLLEQDLYDFSYNIQARRLLGAEFVWFFIQHSSQVPTRSRICMIFHTTFKPGACLEQDL